MAIDLSPSSEDIVASAGRDHTVQIYDRYAHTHQLLFAADAVAHAVAIQRMPLPLHNTLHSEVKQLDSPPPPLGLVYTTVMYVIQPLNYESCDPPPTCGCCAGHKGARWGS